MTKTVSFRFGKANNDRLLRLFPANDEWQVDEIKQAIAAADAAGPDQFVDNDRVMVWMESWGTDQESLPPL